MLLIRTITPQYVTADRIVTALVRCTEGTGDVQAAVCDTQTSHTHHNPIVAIHAMQDHVQDPRKTFHSSVHFRVQRKAKLTIT